VTFAKSRLDDECSLFCCADEVKAKSDGSINHHNSIFYAESADQVPPLPTHKFPLTQDYFCAITANGGLPPMPFSGHLTAVSYQRLLDTALVNVNKKFDEGEWIYVHDSAPYHSADSTQEYLQTHVPLFFTKQEWPSNSPDLNVIENVFADISASLAKQRPKTRAALDRAFRESWKAATTPVQCRQLFASYKKRFQAVIKS